MDTLTRQADFNLPAQVQGGEAVVCSPSKPDFRE